MQQTREMNSEYYKVKATRWVPLLLHDFRHVGLEKNRTLFEIFIGIFFREPDGFKISLPEILQGPDYHPPPS
jgi:hypothetical protein